MFGFLDTSAFEGQTIRRAAYYTNISGENFCNTNSLLDIDGRIRCLSLVVVHSLVY